MTKKMVAEEKAVEGVVEIPFTTLGEAFIKAAVEKKEKQDKMKAVEKEESFLTAEQVESIEVKILSPEELAKEAAEAEERKSGAQALGKKLTQLISYLEQIYSVPNWEFSPKLKEAVSSYEKQIGSLQSQGDEEFRAQVQVALLFARIHTVPATKENVYELMNQVAEQGRGNLCRAESFLLKDNGKRDYGPNAVVFKEQVLVPPNGSLDENGRQNKTNHGLYSALRRKIERYYSEYQKEQEEKMALILSSNASDNLKPLLDRKVKLAEKVGVYRINFPEKRENGKLFRAGAALIEVGFRGTGEKPFLAIEAKEGGGSLADFNEMKGFWVPFGLIFERDLPEKITGKRRENTERVIRVFRAATFELRKAYYDKNNKSKKAKKAKS